LNLTKEKKVSEMMAWYGMVQMKEARWTDEEGSTVTFFLPMNGQEDKRNPFEKFTKRRKGKAGTRFMMACQRVSGTLREAMYEDEVMLTGWNDSQSTGHTVKFWLCNDGMGHPFEGCARKIDQFALSLIELDDDQEPVDQKMRARVENPPKRPSERVSYVAAMLCKEEKFWRWCGDQLHISVINEAGARIAMLDTLGLPSRSVLDKNEYQAKRFHALIRKPYLEWLGET
jgi:hypothetical protein